MSINSISLKNFKCFREIDIKLSKITLLTGANSSGKTALLYGILSPFQSEEFPNYLSPNGKYVNMGDFEEFSFNHSSANKVEINISLYGLYGKDVYISTFWICDPKSKMPKQSYLRATSEFLDLEIKRNRSNVLNFTYYKNKGLDFNKTANVVQKLLLDLEEVLVSKKEKTSEFRTAVDD
ncbi:MAG: AAA family ATPase, partial [Thermodesulfobacteriota bacterium]